MSELQPSDTFTWTQAPWGRALVCVPLADVAPHVFAGRDLGAQAKNASPRDVWLAVGRALGATRVHHLAQVHGGKVIVVGEASMPGMPPEADAMVSASVDAALAVQAADCVPILVADRATGAVGAVHAGWRGTAARAAVAAVRKMGDEWGTKAGDLVVAIGPSIGRCCYEVGPELREAFAAAGFESRDLDRWFEPRSTDRLHLDLWRANHDQLVEAGVSSDHIHVARVCTATATDVFPSYRREGAGAGRLVAAIRARRPTVSGA
ncbi:MAG: peptidoglycan editing factor PgeF [Vicinamibacterales bacterium]